MAVARRTRRTPRPTSIAESSGPPINSVKQGRSKKISFLVYAEPGIGKTVLAGTSGDLDPIPGRNRKQARVLILRPPVDHTDSIDREDDNVEEWILHDWSEADDALMHLRNDGRFDYDWVWIDSLSLWQDQGLDDLWEVIIKEKPHRARYGLDKGDYFINMQRLGRWVRHMVGCPYWNLGVTCHGRVSPSTENEEDPDEKLMPYIQGKNMPQKICGYMNVVGYYNIQKMGKSQRLTRVLHLNPTDTFYAKDQYNSTETGRIIDPTMPKLVGGILASKSYNQIDRSGSSSSKSTTRRHRAAGRK